MHSDLQTVDAYGISALHEACRYSDSSGVLLLIDAGSDVNVKCINGDTPLICASKHNDKKSYMSCMDDLDNVQSMRFKTELEKRKTNKKYRRPFDLPTRFERTKRYSTVEAWREKAGLAF